MFEQLIQTQDNESVFETELFTFPDNTKISEPMYPIKEFKLHSHI